MHDKYQELIAIKLKFEKDINTQQANIDQEKSAKYMALDKIQELEGIDIYLLAMDWVGQFFLCETDLWGGKNPSCPVPFLLIQ